MIKRIHWWKIGWLVWCHKAYNVAEVCELLGTYMLFLISEKYSKRDFRLYWDGGLGMVKSKSGPETKNKKHAENI